MNRLVVSFVEYLRNGGLGGLFTQVCLMEFLTATVHPAHMTRVRPHTGAQPTRGTARGGPHVSVVALCVTRWSLRVRVGPTPPDGRRRPDAEEACRGRSAARLSEIKIPVPPCQLAKMRSPLPTLMTR